jgi:hypothetical protein
MLVASVVPAVARAQSPAGSEKVAAEALFEDGRRLVAEGKFAEACPKFRASQKLDPSAATLLNLASCLEKEGRIATAWAAYREAASAADAAGRRDYVATAQRHADALAPRLARLTLTVDQPLDGLEIKRDGAVVDRAEWGVAIPVDTGSHTIEVSAPGHKGWSTTVTVDQEGAQAMVPVPALEALPPEAPVTAASAPAAPPPVVASAPPQSDRGSGGAARPVGVIAAGVGVLGLGIATVLALEAKSKYDDSLKNCESANPNLCNPVGLSQRDSARSAGTGATVALGLGAAAFAGGLVLWLTAPAGPGRGAAVALAPALDGAAIRGTW